MGYDAGVVNNIDSGWMLLWRGDLERYHVFLCILMRLFLWVVSIFSALCGHSCDN